MKNNKFNSLVLQVTPVLDTAATSSGNVLCATVALAPTLAGQVFEGEIVGVTVLDKDGNGAELDVVLLGSEVDLGTPGSGVSISDADAENVLRIVRVSDSDYTDLSTSKFADVECGKPLKCGTALYVGLIDRTGGNTYAASGIVLSVYLRADNPR